MRAQEPLSSKPGGIITPLSWRRVILIFLLIATVSVLAAGIVHDYHKGIPNPNQSPTCASVQC